jgi:hypothetical protein
MLRLGHQGRLSVNLLTERMAGHMAAKQLVSFGQRHKTERRVFYFGRTL